MKTLLLSLPVTLIAAPALAQVMSPSEYVMTAGAGDLYERTSSQIVLQSTQDQRVREFAQMMIDHHAKSSQEVAAAARQTGLKPVPPRLTAAQAEMIAQLRAETGIARDAAYIAQQKAAHGQALDVQQAYATDGTALPLRAAASDIVPVVRSHIAMLQKM